MYDDMSGVAPPPGPAHPPMTSSRIGDPIHQNLDVPSDKYKEAWAGLTSETVLGVSPYLGVTMAEDATGMREPTSRLSVRAAELRQFST